MTTKPTRKPVHNDHIRFYIVIYGPCDVKERLCSINDMAIGIQCFTLMFLSVRTDDQAGIGNFGAGFFGVLLRVGKLGTELLNGCLSFFDLNLID